MRASSGKRCRCVATRRSGVMRVVQGDAFSNHAEI